MSSGAYQPICVFIHSAALPSASLPSSRTGYDSSRLGPTQLQRKDTTAVRTAGDSVTIRFVDTDIRAAIQALGRYLSKPVLVGAIEPRRVTFETPAAVSRDQIPALLRGLVESQGLTLVEDSVFFRVEVLPPGISVDKSQGGAGGTGGPVQLFVLRLKHAHAGDVAAT